MSMISLLPLPFMGSISSMLVRLWQLMDGETLRQVRRGLNRPDG
jgi:hypothetical protein